MIAVLSVVMWHAMASVTPAEPVRLVYSATGEACPDSAAVEAAVASRLGYSPWAENARRIMRVTVTTENGGLSASMVMLDENGQTLGARTLHSDHGDCTELTAAMTLAISIAVDPLVLIRPQPPPPPPQEPPSDVITPEPAVAEPAPAPPTPASAAPVPTTPPPVHVEPRFRFSPPQLFVRTAVHGSYGLAPFPTGGGALSAGARWSVVSLSAQWDVHAPIRLRNHDVNLSSSIVSLVPCAHAGWLGACAVVGAGAALGLSGRKSVVTPPVLPLVTTGARLQAEVPVWEHAQLGTFVEGRFTPTRVLVRAGDDVEPLWHASGFSITAGISSAVVFP